MNRSWLWLLGPPRVGRYQGAQNITGGGEAAGSSASEVPSFRSRFAVALLGYLVAEQRPVARALLASLFWPDEKPSKGRTNLRRELHNLTHILTSCWELDRHTVEFIPSADTAVDIYQLRDLEAQERWTEAVELLGGEFLEGLFLEDNQEFENWLREEREHWRGCTEEILTRVMDGHVRRGRYPDALRFIRRLLQISPWDEETHRKAMRLLAWTGKRGAALRQYKECQQVLSDELDVKPASETIALYRQILAGQLDLPPQLPAFLTEDKARRKYEPPPFFGRINELKRLDAFLEGALVGNSRVVFITGDPGRGKTALLEAFSRHALDAYPDLLVAFGKCAAYSGLGDPYLPFRDVARMLTGDVEAMWDAGTISRDLANRLWAAFPLVVQALLDYGPHLIDILIPSEKLISLALAAGQDDSPWFSRLREQLKRKGASKEDLEQRQLFQQVTDMLCNVALAQPLLLILDDIQWADTASISLLFHLGRRLSDANSRLLIVCAYRPEEVAMGHLGESHPLLKALNEFKRTFGDVWVDMTRTDDAEGCIFINALLDSTPNRLAEGFRNALFQRTEGHPLFTIELLRAMQERGDLQKDEDGCWVEGPKLDWETLPARVEAVIEERIGRLDPELKDLLSLASVEGVIFSAQILAEGLNWPEMHVLRRLSQELEREHMLVREEEEIETKRRRISRYRFRHFLFQDYLYKRIGLLERQVLHGDVAAALEKLYEGQLDENAVQLAHHYYQANDHERALHYFTMAAERADRAYDSGKAVSNYTRAIQLAETVSPDVVSLAGLYRGRGLAYERLGAFDQAHDDHSTIQDIARAAGEHQMEWRAALDLGKLWSSRDCGKARYYFDSALDSARRLEEPLCLADSLNWMGNWNINDGNPIQAIENHQEALVILEGLGEMQELARTLDLLALSHVVGSDLNAAVRTYDRAIAIFRELDDRIELATSLIGRAQTVTSLDWLASAPPAPLPDAVLDLDEALRIAGEVAVAPALAWGLFSSGRMYTAQGHYGHALEDIKHGLRVADEIGHRHHVVGAHRALGMLYTELFAADEAKVQFEAALTIARELHSPTWIQALFGALAGVYLLLNEHSSTQECLETALPPQTSMDTIGKRYCWVRKAELALAQSQPDRALEITERLIASEPGMSSGQVITYLWKLKSDALAAMWLREDAIFLLLAALNNAHITGEHFLIWRLHSSLGKLHYEVGEQEEGDKETRLAHTAVQDLAKTIPDKVLKDNFLRGAHRTLEAPP